jgi:tRNA nucleotidyltransferase (CCA-adding enzyme)
MEREPAEDRAPAAAHFAHDADIGVRGTGPTIAAAFEQAALAMTAVVSDVDKIRLEETIEIECSAPNKELLLLDWLNAIIFEMATRSMIFGAFKVETDGRRLRGTATGEAISQERHAPAVEIKRRHIHRAGRRRGRVSHVASAVRGRRLAMEVLGGQSP